jgi:glyoxylase-like metal-dependent hydrolase (beta-lactamase superfamily II)/rhodanese-related sulfurtransferase
MRDVEFYQLFEPKSSTYTYLLVDKDSKEAIIIDSVIDTVERDLKLINELGVDLKYAMETHIHADHITGSGILRAKLKAKYVVGKAADLDCADILLGDGEELKFGSQTVKALSTPGHTDSCTSYYIQDRVFTGDALLIRGCGRTDFQQGSPHKLYNSVRNKLFNLPDETLVYPAHDYKGHTSSSIEMEKKHNPRLNLNKSEEEFAEIMNNLNLPHPKQIDKAVPGNKICGLKEASELEPQEAESGVPEISVDQLLQVHLGNVNVIDVRSPKEYCGELGHIKESVLVELDEDFKEKLKNFEKEKRTVFVCKSGKRSAKATTQALELGFLHPMSLEGGMMRWNELKKAVKR